MRANVGAHGGVEAVRPTALVVRFAATELLLAPPGAEVGAGWTEVPFVLGPGEGRTIDLGNFTMVVRAEGEQAGGAFTLLEAAEPPDFGPPQHIHRDAAEAFFVLEGEYRIFLPEGERRCPPESFIYIPAGIEHGFRVGAVASRKLNLYSPAAMVGYFDELSAAIAGGDVDPERLAAIASKFGMDVLGPVPEGYV